MLASLMIFATLLLDSLIDVIEATIATDDGALDLGTQRTPVEHR